MCLPEKHIGISGRESVWPFHSVVTPSCGTRALFFFRLCGNRAVPEGLHCYRANDDGSCRENGAGSPSLDLFNLAICYVLLLGKEDKKTL